MEQTNHTETNSRLSECRLKVQQCKWQLEQNEKDYASLLKQKQDYLYENLAWIALWFCALFVSYILNRLQATLITGSMLVPFSVGMELVCIVLLARVIYLSRHFIGMRDYKRAKFTSFKVLIEDQQLYVQNSRKLLARAEKELEEAQAQADAADADAKKNAAEPEERMVERWDQQDMPDAGASGSLSDTARLIREALERDE